MQLFFITNLCINIHPIPFQDVLVRNKIYFARKEINFVTIEFFFVMNEIKMFTNELNFVTYEIDIFTDKKYYVNNEFHFSIMK